ncbi:MAG: serine hydrolase [bacterium]|nr:serine hydrolase [bacterium]
MRANLIFVFVCIMLFLVGGCSGSEGPTEPENDPPICSIQSPENSVRYPQGGDILIRIDASDADGSIDYVGLYINNQVVATLRESPYEFTWETTEYDIGNYSIRARAVDNDNAITWSSIDMNLGYVYSVPVVDNDGFVTDHVDEVGIDTEPLIDLMNEIGINNYRDIHSVLIYKNNTLVFEEYFTGYDFGYAAEDYHGTVVDFNRNTTQNTHSATKSVCSALVGLAIDNGFINSVDDPIMTYLPDYSDVLIGGKENITIRHLLTMSSGLEWNEMDVAVNDEQDVSRFNQSSDPIGFLLGKVLLHEPGTIYYYNGGGVDLLGEIVRIASSMDVSTFAEQYLFNPIGVTNFQFQTLYPSGIVATHGDIYIRPRDMMKFGLLFLNNGVWNSNRVISQEWVEDSLEDIIFPSTHSGMADGYGYLWWVQTFNVNSRTIESFSARGWGENEIYVFPDYDTVVVLSGSNYTGRYQPTEMLRDYILPAIIN